MTRAWNAEEARREEIAAMEDPPVGTVLYGTKYSIVRRLGRGGMGVVYEVIKPPHITGVLKRMAPELSRNATARELFLSEVQALSELDHPHIVRVYDFDTDGYGVPYMVMEKLTGRTVATLVEKRGKVPLPEVAEITRQLLSALECAHTHEPSIVHRDIKPENVFLHQPKHGASILKLIDFGLVVEAGNVHAFAGSIHYAAPEQILSSGAITPRTDLYAVGAMMYEMLAGQMPYDGPTLSAISEAKVTRPPVPLKKVAPHVPREVADLVERALARDPAMRPESAKAFREELDRALGRSEAEAAPRATAIPAVTRVGQKLDLPAEKPLSPDTLLHAGLPANRGWPWLWREILAGLAFGLLVLAVLHVVLTRPS